MLEEIIKKLNINSCCELSVEELKILYEVDYIVDTDLEEKIYLKRAIRDMKYDDLSKIFGKEHVAQNKNDIDENTICYIGNLTIDSKLPTYNLRYVYGNLQYELDEVHNLENLEIIIGNFILKYYNDLDNLKVITSELRITNIIGYCDLSLIEKVDTIKIYELRCAKNIVFPNNLRSLFLPKLNDVTGLKLPSNLKNLHLDSLYYYKKIKFPDSLEQLYIRVNLEYISNLVVSENVKLIDEYESYLMPKYVPPKVLKSFSGITVLENEPQKTLSKKS